MSAEDEQKKNFPRWNQLVNDYHAEHPEDGKKEKQKIEVTENGKTIRI